jgi:hypothetical protein
MTFLPLHNICACKSTYISRASYLPSETHMPAVRALNGCSSWKFLPRIDRWDRRYFSHLSHANPTFRGLPSLVLNHEHEQGILVLRMAEIVPLRCCQTTWISQRNVWWLFQIFQAKVISSASREQSRYLSWWLLGRLSSQPGPIAIMVPPGQT